MRLFQITALVLFLAPAVGHAINVSPGCPPVPDDQQELKAIAKAWFSKGETLVKEQMYAEAIGAFGCSLEMMEHPATLLNIAKAANKAKFAEVELEAYEKYLELVEDGDKANEARKRAFLVLEMIRLQKPFFSGNTLK